MSDGLHERAAATDPSVLSPPDFASLLAYAPRPDLLAGRVIAITGGAGGIGRAVALGAARSGATVIVLDRSRAGLKALQQTLAAESAPAPDVVPMDFTSASIADYQQFAQRIDGQYGHLDGLVNNVSLIGALTPFEHAEPAVWQQVIAANLVAPFFLTQWCMPLLRRAPDPALVFSLHRAQRAFWGAYGMAKAGQEALLHILADEYHLAGDAPVRVFGIDTGPVATAARRQHYPAEPPDAHPKPAEVVGPYLYALGPDARGMTDVVLRRE
ncbi:MAG TPA: SDR family NAD(P)-dependent oxidoreductase [Rhodanobacteraceae bacterium]